MKKAAILIAFCLNLLNLNSQPDADAVLKEGQLLYRMEKGSWFGTDLFVAYFRHMADRAGGYLSYEGEDRRIYTIFFDKNNNDSLLVRFAFDSLPITIPVTIDTVYMAATRLESDLISMRQDALDNINGDTTSFYRFYKNTSFNLIPLIMGKERRVYFITGPQNAGVVLIGNDYLLKYDSHNNLVSRHKIHNSLIELSAGSASDTGVVATMHSHVLSDIIDPTDICTLLLYRDFITWKKHYVLSSAYVSLFDMEKQTLLIMKRKDWDKISSGDKDKKDHR
jgi:hypothetical protein